MAKRHHLTDEERESLIAYLDGELDEAAARGVESKISSNPSIRTEFDGLRRTWEMLDYLPRPAASPAFTSRTLDSVTILRPTASKQKRRWWLNWWVVGVTWALLVILAALAGYKAVRRPQSRQNSAQATHEPDEDEQEWLDGLPRATRDELDKLPFDKRAVRIAELKESRRKRDAEWQIALGGKGVVTNRRDSAEKLKAFAQEIKTFTNDSLQPMLNATESKRLRQSEDDWPLYLAALVDLSDTHPIPLPGPTVGPKTFDELPADIRRLLPPGTRNPNNRFPALARTQGRWPAYARNVTRLIEARGGELPRQLGPSEPSQFSQAVQEFIRTKLLPVLTPDESASLQKAQGHWPAYPDALLELSREHNLPIPGMTLPGPRELWQAFRG